MDNMYSNEISVQILISLMKQHGVRYVVASPGTTNIAFVASVQNDSWFKVYSSVDERSAAYIACGIAAESGEPVAISCTGATASRNYFPGLTEAYYRKLPILAITSAQHPGRVGHNIPQVIDRSTVPNDVCRISVEIDPVTSPEDRWACEVSINKALLELKRHSGGPVHINLVTSYDRRFETNVLPTPQVINRIVLGDELPQLLGKKVAVLVGAHAPWTNEQTSSLDKFCEYYGALVICDQTSNYRGTHRVLGALVASQEDCRTSCNNFDILIYIGNISGAYLNIRHKEAWRVHPDGEVRDPFRGLRYVFEMDETAFFDAYVGDTEGERTQKHGAFDEWQDLDCELRSRIPVLPFSNLWCAQVSSTKVPSGSSLHLGILNSLRSWNFFETPSDVNVFCNTGGFGIDGCMSTLLGASLVSPNKLVFGVLGDLAAFYDLNSLGNRHLGSNVRIMMINNGVGTEFKNFNHMAYQFGESADSYIAARGHFGNKSRVLLRHYTEDLGFEYVSATTKSEFLAKVDYFFSPERRDRPTFFEVFTDSRDESDALNLIMHLDVDASLVAKRMLVGALGDKGVSLVKKVLGK